MKLKLATDTEKIVSRYMEVSQSAEDARKGRYFNFETGRFLDIFRFFTKLLSFGLRSPELYNVKWV